MRYVLLVVWLTGALVGVPACSSDVRSGMQSANELLYRQKYVDAERLYRKLLKRVDSQKELSERDDEQRLQILDRLGKINALYLRDYSQAVADYESLIRKYPKTDQCLSALTTVADLYHYRLANLQQAVDAYQRLVSQFPERTEARHAQLEIIAAYFKLKNYEQARLEADALRKRWPSTPEASQAQFEIADSYYVQKRYTEAIATYETLLGKGQDSNLTSLVLFELGNCYQELGEGERALIYYYSSLPNHPNPGLVQRKIARVRSRLHHTAPADNILNAQAPTRQPLARKSARSRPPAMQEPAKSPADAPSSGENDAEGVKE